jgi:3,4-dihydroxy 2-butanone 4-phosphate synthase/GTP cyclohydrolase II
MPISSIEDIIDDIRQGKMVVLVDDEDRENEGDLVMAASYIKPEDINFMSKFGRGLICLTLTRERCETLQLPLMVSNTDTEGTTNFTISIEAASGVTTGISAHDRATTVQAAVAKDAKPGDIVMPGHIFPLMAQPGGVLTRAGHTEAGCDLSRLAGLEPAAVIVEILNEDGTMARRPDLEVFAKQHDLKIGAIADLIHYRIEKGKTVERIAECDMPTEFGHFLMVSYLDAPEDEIHLALVKGDISPDDEILVRVHVKDPLCDILGAQRSECGWSLHEAMASIEEAGKGIVVVLNRHENTQQLQKRLQGYQAHDKGAAADMQYAGDDMRTYGVGAQIIADLGVRRMRVLGSPRKLHGLSGFGLEIAEYVPHK